MNFTQPILIVESDRQGGLVSLPFVNGIGRLHGDYKYVSKGRSRIRVQDANYRLKVVQSDMELVIYETDEEPEPVLMALISALADRLELLEIEVFGGVIGPVVIDFPDFSSIQGLQLNGATTRLGNALLLTPDENGLAGSMFFATPIPLSSGTGFRCHFQFQVTGDPDGADGFTFCLQNSAAGAIALGEQGGSLGYAPTITNSLAVEFDTYQGEFDLSDNEISVLRDGSTQALATASSGLPNLSGGQILNTWIDYLAGQLQVYLSDQLEKPVAPILSYPINLFGVVGNQFYAGFTAGTGGLTNAHQLRSWSFSTLST